MATLNISTFGKGGVRELTPIEGHLFDCPELPNARFFVHKVIYDNFEWNIHRSWWQVSEYITGTECGFGGRDNTRQKAIVKWRAFCREYESDSQSLAERVSENITAYLAQYQTPANAE